MYRNYFFRFTILICLISIYNDAKADNAIQSAMRDELRRSMNELSLPNLQKPYYIEYTLTKRHTYAVKSILGGLLYSRESPSSSLSVGVRVGSQKFDNTNYFDVALGFFGSADDEESFRNRRAALKPDYDQFRRELWLATDACYKQAAELYSKKESAVKNRLRTDTIPDFYLMPPKVLSDTTAAATFDKKYFEELAKELSAVFLEFPSIVSSSVGIEYLPKKVMYINSEGREFERSDMYIGVEVVASTQANDGMILGNAYSCYARIPNELPTKDSLKKAVQHLAATLSSTKNAQKIEDSYAGPILFTGQAAAECFAQVFAPNLVAQRFPLTERGLQEDDRFAHFQNKIGGRTLPEFLSVEAIPQKRFFGKTPLCGFYTIDDDGFEAENVTLVKEGYLKTLLSSRIPTKRVKESNGHQRGGAAMLSSILVSANQSEKKKILSEKDLKTKLLKLCKDRSLPYGVIIKKILNQNLLFTVLYGQTAGEFPFAQGVGKLSILEAVKLYPDGSEELLRGIEVAGMTTQTFKDIIAVGNKLQAYNYLAPAVSSPFMTGGDQYLISSMIVPDVLFEDGEIAPLKSDFPKPPYLPSPQANR